MNYLFSRVFSTCSAMLLCSVLIGQDITPFNDFNTQRERITSNSMLVLGGWAAGNMIAGGIGMATTENGTEAFHFHQMNLSWGVVNLGIALPSYFGARKKAKGKGELPDIPNTFRLQRRTEAVYLINSGLDFAFLGAGLWLWERGSNSTGEYSEVFRGFGTSIMMQGGFLLIYDLANYFIHAKHWKRGRAKLWDQVEFNGTSIQYKF